VKSPRAIVSVAFSREDFEHVADYAKRHGMKVSELIRKATLDQITPDQPRAVVTSVTGAVQTNFVTIAAPRAKIEVRIPQSEVLATT
jgi:hypothetical protein